MNRTLQRSNSFVRSARRLVKKNPDVTPRLRSALRKLAEDAFQPSLKTHKLKGRLSGTFACSVDRDLRIIFELVEHEEAEAILLQTIGNHDEVY